MADEVVAALARVTEAVDSLTEQVASLELTFAGNEAADDGMVYLMMSGVHERLDEIRRVLRDIEAHL
jgi:hypothetical protein